LEAKIDIPLITKAIKIQPQLDMRAVVVVESGTLPLRGIAKNNGVSDEFATER
jgi:hypothetical protein